MSSKDLYSVQLYSSRLGLPLFFVVHTYIVTEYRGTKNRYDLFSPAYPPKASSYCGNIFKNLLSPELGFSLFYKKDTWWLPLKKLRWQVRRCGEITGTTNSQAYLLYSFIENDGLKMYPYKDFYRLVSGPNSNTFIQWVINQVPETKLTLPWNAWGKGYKIQ